MSEKKQIIKSYLKTLGNDPGVYRMLNKKGEVLYVGKAKNLRKRVENYTHPEKQSNRIQRMIHETAAMEFVITKSETEALLLEANLIKKLKPKYNVLLRDDKNFSFIKIQKHHDFPGIFKIRAQQKTIEENEEKNKDKGKNKNKKEKSCFYFGPFISTKAIDQTIDIITKVFKLRTCSDYDFKTRKRPCLQYHIKRCSAPCVGKITKDEYKKNLDLAIKFLRGDDQKIKEEFAKQMNEASKRLEYEKAAEIRDKIKDLSLISSNQIINVSNLPENSHVIGFYIKENNICMQVLFYNKGRHYGSHSTIPDNINMESLDEIKETLSILVRLFYENTDKPDLLIIGANKVDHHTLKDLEKELNSALDIKITTPQRGDKKDLLDYAINNAQSALKRKLSQKLKAAPMLEALQKHLNLEQTIKRIEVYDNSHISGTNALGAMIVVTESGFDKKSYRKFNMERKDIKTPGDDYEMMYKMLKRRFSGSTAKEAMNPDLIILDGGAGQLSIGQRVLKELNLEIPIIAIAKGPKRNAGEEKIFIPGKKEYQLSKDDPLLHFLQNVRDESHRFVIASHRKKREKSITKSKLDSIPGIGPKKKKALLNYFGSLKTISALGIEDLQKAPGISKELATKIYIALKE